MKFHRVHIIGAPGSGKTYLSEQLSVYMHTRPQDLDDIFWDNRSLTYGTKMPEDIRDALLRSVIQKPIWIIEGVYYKWLPQSFEKADIIVIIRPPHWLRNARILKRFFLRKIGVLKSKKETLHDLTNLIVWGNTYEREKIPEILQMTQQYVGKVHSFPTADSALQFLVMRK